MFPGWGGGAQILPPTKQPWFKPVLPRSWKAPTRIPECSGGTLVPTLSQVGKQAQMWDTLGPGGSATWTRHTPGGLNKFIFSQFWRLEVQDQGVGRSGFSSVLPPWLAALGLNPPPPPTRLLTRSQFCQIKIHPNSFIPSNHLFEGLISRYSYTQGHWGLGPSA